jgi:membrane-bound lytic murein transglycosylase B
LWPAIGDTAAALAAQLTELERTIRSDSATPDEIVTAGEEQQLAYRRFAAHPEWDEAVLAAVGTDVHDAVFNNIEARRAFTRDPSTRPPADTVPAWRLVAPRPADELIGYYQEAEALIGVPWPYLAAINLIETRMGRIIGLSTAGAQGPMQFLPSTWADCCTGDIDDPRDAIIGAATYLKSNGAPGDMDRAIFRYNHDERYVAAVKAYAANIAADERAYRGYHAWQVFYASSAGDIRLPIGYEQAEPVAASQYLALHPEDRLPAT